MTRRWWSAATGRSRSGWRSRSPRPASAGSTSRPTARSAGPTSAVATRLPTPAGRGGWPPRRRCGRRRRGGCAPVDRRSGWCRTLPCSPTRSFPTPPWCRPLSRRGVPHLAVRLRDGSGVIGPLVLPGRTSCLRCLDLQRAAHDPGWPLVAAQLAGRRGAARSTCVGAAAALAADQALAALEGQASPTPPPAVLNATLEFDSRSAVLQHRPLPPQQDCPCGAAGAGCGERSSRETIIR